MAYKESAWVKERRKIAEQKKKDLEKANKNKENTCGDCANGKWKDDIQWNLDLEGKPLTKRCPYYEDGKYGVLRSQSACYHFKSK